MPRLLKDFDATEPDAVGVYAIDFGNDLPSGGRLVSAKWTLGLHHVLPGAQTDLFAAMRLVGAATVSGSLASQKIAGLVDGNDYLLTCSGTMSDGEVVELWTVLPCRAPS